MGHRRPGPDRREARRGLRRRRWRDCGGRRVEVAAAGAGLRRTPWDRTRLRKLRRADRRPRRRRAVRRHPAHQSRGHRRCRVGSRQGAARGEVVHRHERRGGRGRGAGPVDRHVRDGGDVDALPAGRRTVARARRRRRDRPGAVGAGRPGGAARVRRQRPAVRPRARRRRAAGPRGLRRVVRADAAGRPCHGAGGRIAVRDRGRCRGDAAARVRRRPVGGPDDVAPQRAAGAGAGVRHRRVDRRAPPLPPPADDRAAPGRRRSRAHRPGAARRRLRARADRGHRVPAGRPHRERGHAAGRHARRPGRAAAGRRPARCASRGGPA